MEAQIIQHLISRGRTDFMELRALFPIDTNFKPAYTNLLRLKLITENVNRGNNGVSATEGGIQANLEGLETWIKIKLLDEIKKGEFVLTKELTKLEMDAARELEQEGLIYQSERFRFKISPYSENHKSINKNPSNTVFIKQNPSTQWRDVLGVVGWIVTIFVGLLGILEYKFGYVAQVWEWIIK